ncbi:hypothetical protein cypCar_00029673 [Cyprinus carpio]|nr:hypothetical protein cypCar_00029673 [Cyprinus carpio]
MHLHQVLTGAVNPGDCCYSVGSVHDVPFTAYGSGCDIVILASDFECVQIIPGAQNGNIQVGCVECSQQLGRILQGVHKLSAGNRILAATEHLQLWAPPTSDTLIEEEDSQLNDDRAHELMLNDWKCIWQCKGSVCNVLLTSCADGICRLWSETLLPEDSLLGGQISENSSSFSSSLPNIAQKDKIQHALESIHHLKHLRRGRRRSSALVAHTELLPSQLGSHETHRHISHHANALCHFHISASINPNTDIPAMLAGSGLFSEDVSGGFVVHWLNNKDLSFTTSMDLFMQQLRKLSEQHLEQATEDFEQEGAAKFDFDLDDMSDKGSSEHEEGDQEGSTKASSPGSSSSAPLPSVLLDRKLETLILEWNKSPDMLFTIHPHDGSFLVWHIKYLDEFIPGIFRQVQVSFSSRIPVAFPTGDANSLSKNIMMYACTFMDQENCSALEDKRSERRVPQSASASAGLSALGHSLAAVIGPAVMMVSKHVDGSLNQWAVTFAEKSAFSNVLTVSHKFRYCGHRFHLNDLACHTVLPLLLTSSHHNALLTPSGSGNVDGDQNGGVALQPTRPMRGIPRKQLRNAATLTFHDPNAIYSELILWRVDHIGPLSCTGGVSELARINSLHTSAFSNVAWLPTLIPSSVLGTYCNSASACFVASDGKNLRLYQAVVDARKLLDELSDPETSKLVGEVFNIVSQQSTARPGCIIELDVITNQCGSNTQLLHVFQEDFILGYKPHEDIPDFNITSVPSGQEYQPPPFSEKFFLVVIEKDANRNSVLQMWHLHLRSVQACVEEPINEHVFQNQLTVPLNQNYGDSSPDTTPGHSPLPRSSSSANLQSASKLILSSKLVYSQRLDLPPGVELIRATPSAGMIIYACIVTD